MSYMPLSEQRILSIISRELADFSPVGKLQPLSGGHLNHVWRLKGKTKNLIVKHAPPFIASNLDVPLNPKRIHFEARALKLFQTQGALNPISSDYVQPPHVLYFDDEMDLLFIEDLGRQPSLTEWLVNNEGDGNIGTKLGHFVGLLHVRTFRQKEFNDQFNNSDIQQTRLEVQYKPAVDYAKRAGISDTEAIQSKTEALGKKLLTSGRCLVMGDLWPPSILVKDDKLRLIDWEFAHYGRPLQDVAHFAAHCWMQAHTSPKEHKTLFINLWKHFWEGYQQTVGRTFEILFNKEEFDDAATHIGAEILVRAAGPFKEGYIYENFNLEDEKIKEAGIKARELILADDFSTLWH